MNVYKLVVTKCGQRSIRWSHSKLDLADRGHKAIQDGADNAEIIKVTFQSYDSHRQLLVTLLNKGSVLRTTERVWSKKKRVQDHIEHAEIAPTASVEAIEPHV